MVGIAKKDYCATCRRRRVKCDCTRPNCIKCITAGRVCEGYERYPVFLNRTQSGLERRKALEDVKPPATGPSDQTDATYRLSHNVSSSPPRQGSGFNIFDTQFIEIFLREYLPEATFGVSKAPYVWVQDALSVSDPSNSLQLALQALCRSRAGFVRNDEALQRAGRTTYAKALRTMQSTLQDAQLARRDDTLASARAFSLFELLESAASDGRAFSEHQSGMAALIQLRGIDSFKTVLPIAVFEDVRMTFAYRAIQFRKSSFLGSKDWTTIPWEGREKSPKQLLYDAAFSLANLLEHFDGLAAETASDALYRKYQTFMSSCKVFENRLFGWHRALFESRPEIQWEKPQSGIVDRAAPDMDAAFYGDFEFADITIAHMLLDYWGIQIRFYEVIAHTIEKITELETDFGSHDEPQTLSADNTPRFQESETYTIHYVQTLQTEAAFNIIRSLDYCFDTRMGTYGPQCTLFGIATAFQILSSHPGPMFERCNVFYNRLARGKGVSHARYLKVVL